MRIDNLLRIRDSGFCERRVVPRYIYTIPTNFQPLCNVLAMALRFIRPVGRLLYIFRPFFICLLSGPLFLVNLFLRGFPWLLFFLLVATLLIRWLVLYLRLSGMYLFKFYEHICLR